MKTVNLVVIDTVHDITQSCTVKEPVQEGFEFRNAAARFVPVDGLRDIQQVIIKVNGEYKIINIATVEGTSKIVTGIIY